VNQLAFQPSISSYIKIYRIVYHATIASNDNGCLFEQGRQAIEWVISRLKEETHDIGRAARLEMDKHFNQNTTSL